MKKGWIAVVIALGCGALVWGVRRQRLPSHTRDWPGQDAPITVPAVEFPPGFGTPRVVVDAGHGAAGNTGNRSSFCRDEQDFTLSLALDLARELKQTGHFEVITSRTPGALVPYRARVRQAERWHAAAFISLHSDVRGKPVLWSPRPGQRCSRSRSAPGFAVLWSDVGDAELVQHRLRLARALGAELQAMGLAAYDGREYRGIYDGDEVQPGVFVDRHPAAQRIYVLHAPTLPSVIVETHNAWDDREARRWEDPELRRAFGAAVAAALVQLLSPPGAAGSG